MRNYIGGIGDIIFEQVNLLLLACSSSGRFGFRRVLRPRFQRLQTYTDCTTALPGTEYEILGLTPCDFLPACARARPPQAPTLRLSGIHAVGCRRRPVRPAAAGGPCHGRTRIIDSATAGPCDHSRVSHDLGSESESDSLTTGMPVIMIPAPARDCQWHRDHNHDHQ